MTTIAASVEQQGRATSEVSKYVARAGFESISST